MGENAARRQTRAKAGRREAHKDRMGGTTGMRRTQSRQKKQKRQLLTNPSFQKPTAPAYATDRPTGATQGTREEADVDRRTWHPFTHSSAPLTSTPRQSPRSEQTIAAQSDMRTSVSAL